MRPSERTPLTCLALKSMDAVRAKLKQAILYIERNPKLATLDTYCFAQPRYYF
jgi:hypothetical protein